MRSFGATLGLAMAAILGFGSLAKAADNDQVRPYLGLRVGSAYFFDDKQAPGIELQNPSQYPFPHLNFGANLNKYWGAEIAVDYADTNVEVDGVSSKAGEYAFWTVLGQARLRYPLLDNRLVPYAVGGIGIGIAEFNDRNVNADFNFQGSQDTSFIGAAGVGVEYFIAHNISLDLQAKGIFGFETEVVINGRKRQFDLDNILLSAGLRIFFDGMFGTPGPTESLPPAADQDRLRFYAVMRVGGAFQTNPNESSALGISTPNLMEFGAGAGINIDKHWGFEVAGEFWEPTLRAPGFGDVAEYTLYTVLGQIRYRYPLLEDRFVPYVIAGGGLGVAEMNDRKKPFSTFPLSEETFTMPVGAVGGGVEYFLADNIAVGLETKYIFAFENDATIGTQKATLDNSTVLLGASLRLFFP